MAHAIDDLKMVHEEEMKNYDRIESAVVSVMRDDQDHQQRGGGAGHAAGCDGASREDGVTRVSGCAAAFEIRLCVDGLPRILWQVDAREVFPAERGRGPGG